MQEILGKEYERKQGKKGQRLSMGLAVYVHVGVFGDNSVCDCMVKFGFGCGKRFVVRSCNCFTRIVESILDL